MAVITVFRHSQHSVRAQSACTVSEHSLKHNHGSIQAQPWQYSHHNRGNRMASVPWLVLWLFLWLTLLVLHTQSEADGNNSGGILGDFGACKHVSQAASSGQESTGGTQRAAIGWQRSSGGQQSRSNNRWAARNTHRPRGFGQILRAWQHKA